MKSTFFPLAIFCALTVNAQNYMISFTGSGASDVVGTVKVENLTADTFLEMNGTDILHLTGTVGIHSVDHTQLSELKIYPNPMKHYSILEVSPALAGEAVISVYDISGREIFKDRGYLDKGRQEFRISGMDNGLYMISIRGNTFHYSGKILSTGESEGAITIEKLSNNFQVAGIEGSKIDSKGIESIIDMEYTEGDRLKFTGVSGIYSTVLTDVPASNKTINFNFVSCTDGDNNNYTVVKIGTQTWMAENLKTTKFNDGTIIALVKDRNEWIELTTPGYCWYVNDLSNKDVYGALYNWYALSATTNGNKNVCPLNWHVPSDLEWKQLEMYLGMSQSDSDELEWRGTNEGGELKETGYDHWDSPNEGADNSSGFTGISGGYRWSDGYFLGGGNFGLYWSCTESDYDSDYAWKRTLKFDHASIYRYYNPKKGGFSVRCIIDDKTIIEPKTSD